MKTIAIVNGYITIILQLYITIILSVLDSAYLITRQVVAGHNYSGCKDKMSTISINFHSFLRVQIVHKLTQIPYGRIHKVNRCLARYSPRATTANRPTNRAPKKPAWPGPYQPKMPILGQIWSFLGKKSFFLLEES